MGLALKSFLLALVMAILSVPIHLLHVELDGFRKKQTAEESLRYIPSGKYLSVAVLGYDNVVSDFMWFRSVAMFGEKYGTTLDLLWYDWLYQVLDVASELNKLSRPIYKYGGIMLRIDDNHVDQSTYLLAKGMENVPNYYFFPYLIGMNYVEHKHDSEQAAKYIRMAATDDDAPFYLRNLAATLLDGSQQEEAAIRFLEEQLPTLKPDSLEYTAVTVKIQEMKHNYMARRLHFAFSEYLSKYGKIPNNLHEIENKTFKEPWPKDPYGGDFILDPKSQTIRSSMYETARAKIRKDTGLGSVEDFEESGPRKKKNN